MRLRKETFGEILREERGIVILMGINLVLAIVLTVMTLIRLSPNSTVVTIGYGDIGGYRDGAWTNILEFLVAGFLFGVVHSFLAMRIFDKRGAAMAKFFLMTTTMLIFGSMLILIRVFNGN